MGHCHTNRPILSSLLCVAAGMDPKRRLMEAKSNSQPNARNTKLTKLRIKLNRQNTRLGTRKTQTLNTRGEHLGNTANQKDETRGEEDMNRIKY